MMHIEDYCQNNSISRRHVKRLVDKGVLASTKLNGQRYIIVPPSAQCARYGCGEIQG
jgi:predicted site-specific integrase-resolvase